MNAEAGATVPAVLTLEPIPVPSDEIHKSALLGLSTVRALIVDSTESFERMAAYDRRLKTLHDEAEEKRAAMKKPILEMGRSIDAMFRPWTEAFAAGRAEAKARMIVYHDAQEAIRREAERVALEEQRRLQRLADEAAADVRRKADAESARLRDEAEAAAAAGRADEAAKLQAKAAKVDEKAENKIAVLDAAAAEAAVQPVAVVAAKSSMSPRAIWGFEILDSARFVLEHPELCMPNETMIGGLVKSLKGEAQKILGAHVRVTSSTALSAKGR